MIPKINTAQNNILLHSKKIENQDSKSFNQDLKKASNDFEAYFLYQMMQEMRKTLSDENHLIPKRNGEKIFEDMLDDNYSQILTKRGGIGLSQFIYNQMKK